jgi:flagellin
VNTQRAMYGAVQNRFEAMIQVLQVNTENTSAARGRIMDADFATETANLSRSQILQQAASAMVAQANALPQQVLQLLRG